MCVHSVLKLGFMQNRHNQSEARPIHYKKYTLFCPLQSEYYIPSLLSTNHSHRLADSIQLVIYNVNIFMCEK
jgi:hypothetical protein